MSVDILPPRKSRALLIDGWSVPLIDATELDGGRVFLTLDQRFGLELPVSEFENVARFLANTIATCWGYGAHPRGDELPREDRDAHFARVPLPSAGPRRMHEITGAA